MNEFCLQQGKGLKASMANPYPNVMSQCPSSGFSQAFKFGFGCDRGRVYT